MPIYEYRCEKCNRHHDIMQKITDNPLTTCPNCGGVMTKLISTTSFVLKGSGWYVTDYAGKGKKEAKEGTDKKEGPGTTANKETKQGAKAESTAPAETKK